jgi:hypothetical protein
VTTAALIEVYHAQPALHERSGERVEVGAALTWSTVEEDHRRRTGRHWTCDAEIVAGSVQHDFVRPGPQCRSQLVLADRAALTGAPRCAGAEQAEQAEQRKAESHAQNTIRHRSGIGDSPPHRGWRVF